MKKIPALFLVLMACTFGLLGGGVVIYLHPALASRNSAGTMSAANGPYVTGSTISSSAINSRYSDIENELTNSLDRNGRGGMLAALRGIDGTVNAPALSFTSETGSGLYRIGTNDVGMAINGVKKAEWKSTFFDVLSGSSGATPSAFSSMVVESSGAHLLSILSPNANNEGICYGDVANSCRGGIDYFNSANGSADQMQFHTGGSTVRATISNSGLTIGASGTAIAAANSATSVALASPTNVSAQSCQSVFSSGLTCTKGCAASASAALASTGNLSISCGGSQVWVCNGTAATVTMPVGLQFTAFCVN